MTLGLEMSDTKVYEPYIRALLGTASHYCEAVEPGHAEPGLAPDPPTPLMSLPRCQVCEYDAYRFLTDTESHTNSTLVVG